MTKDKGWIGVDLDGTLAHYSGCKSEDDIGDPVEPMLKRVKEWLAQGQEVRIFTARVSESHSHDSRIKAAVAIKNWLQKHLGTSLYITYKKDAQMVELWDDRAVQVEPNTGRRIDGNV